MRANRSKSGNPELWGISVETIAAICQVHITTARRWKRGEEAPFAARKLVELATTGSMEVVDPKWSGWRMHNGWLVSPDGTEFTPGDVMASRYWEALARSYQTQQRFEQQADWISERWEPAKEMEAAG